MWLSSSALRNLWHSTQTLSVVASTSLVGGDTVAFRVLTLSHPSVMKLGLVAAYSGGICLEKETARD